MTTRDGAGLSRLEALQAYQESLVALIDALEGDGVTAAEHGDLARARARLHAARAEAIAVAAEAAAARYRLEALTGGALGEAE